MTKKLGRASSNIAALRLRTDHTRTPSPPSAVQNKRKKALQLFLSGFLKNSTTPHCELRCQNATKWITPGFSFLAFRQHSPMNSWGSILAAASMSRTLMFSPNAGSALWVSRPPRWLRKPSSTLTGRISGCPKSQFSLPNRYAFSQPVSFHLVQADLFKWS